MSRRGEADQDGRQHPILSGFQAPNSEAKRQQHQVQRECERELARHRRGTVTAQNFEMGVEDEVHRADRHERLNKRVAAGHSGEHPRRDRQANRA